MLLANIFTRHFCRGNIHTPIMQTTLHAFKCASMVDSLLSEIFWNESNIGMSAEYFFKVGRT